MSNQKTVKRISKQRLNSILEKLGPDDPIPLKVSKKGLKALASFASRKK